jgi:hypothetical protein
MSSEIHRRKTVIQSSTMSQNNKKHRTQQSTAQKHTNSVYSNNLHTIDDLKMIITEYIRNAESCYAEHGLGEHG